MEKCSSNFREICLFLEGKTTRVGNFAATKNCSLKLHSSLARLNLIDTYLLTLDARLLLLQTIALTRLAPNRVVADMMEMENFVLCKEDEKATRASKQPRRSSSDSDLRFEILSPNSKT